LYDIEVDETDIQVYVDDGEVVFIVIQEEDLEPEPEPDPDPATGEVTYIDTNSIFVKADGKTTEYKMSAPAKAFKDAGLVKVGDGVSFELLDGATDPTIWAFTTVTLNSSRTISSAYTVPAAFEGIIIAGQGSTKTTVTLGGDLTVDADNATIKGITFAGSKLIVSAAVENDFDANDVVAPNVEIKGGGSNSVKFVNSKLTNVTVDKANVRVVLDKTEATAVTVAKAAKVEIAGTGSVGTLTANAAVEVTGADKVETANVNVNGVKLDKAPETVVLGTGVEVEIGGDKIDEDAVDLANATKAVEAAEAEKAKLVEAKNANLTVRANRVALEDAIEDAQDAYDDAYELVYEDEEAIDEDLANRLADVQYAIEAAKEALAIAELVADLDMVVEDAENGFTAKFDKAIDATGIEGYKIDVLVTLDEALPEGAKVTVKYNGTEAFEGEVEGKSIWLADLVLDGEPADFVSGDAATWTITVSIDDLEEDVTISGTIESIISNDDFEDVKIVIADGEFEFTIEVVED